MTLLSEWLKLFYITPVISNLPENWATLITLKFFDLLAINNSCYSSIVYFFGVTNLLFSKRHLIYIFWRKKLPTSTMQTGILSKYVKLSISCDSIGFQTFLSKHLALLDLTNFFTIYIIDKIVINQPEVYDDILSHTFFDNNWSKQE